MNAEADVNLNDNWGETPLMNAAKFGYDLIQAGANVNQENRGGYTALFKAAKAGNDKCIEVLIKAGADVNDLRGITYKDDSTLETKYLTMKTNFTALMLAAQYGHAEYVTILIDAGADVNLARKHQLSGGVFYNDDTALIVAAEHGRASCTQLLLEARADVNKTNCQRTALESAAKNGDDECVQMLIQTGMHEKIYYKYAFSKAMAFKHENITGMLVEALGYENIPEDYLMIALLHGTEGGNQYCADLLKDHLATGLEAAVHKDYAKSLKI